MTFNSEIRTATPAATPKNNKHSRKPHILYLLGSIDIMRTEPSDEIDARRRT